MGARHWIATGGAVAFTAIALLWFVGAIGAAPLQTGKQAPDFSLKDQDGRTRKLSDYRGAPVVLTFYPADMTSGCTLEAHSLRDRMHEFAARGVQVFGISVQDVASKREFCDKDSLNYPLLADVGGKVADAYGVRMPAGFAKRVTFVVDAKGQVAQTIDQVDVQNHAEQVLKALGPAAAPATPAKVAIGQRLGDVYLPDVATGKMVSLFGDGNQKATVAIFVASECPVSRAYEGRMAALAREFGGSARFVGIGSNSNDTTEKLAAHFAAAALGFPIVKDAHNRIADRFVAHVTPEAFVFDAGGVLRYHGRIDDSVDASAVHASDLRDAIRAVVAGKTPAASERLAMGCGIRRE